MYSPAASAGQSSESVESSTFGGDTLNSRLMPRGTHTGDEELVFRNDSSKSKAAQNHSYMASISTGQKVRSTMSGSTTRMGAGTQSASSSSASVNQPLSPRSASSTGHYPRASHPRHAARASAGPGAAAGPSAPGSPSAQSDRRRGAQAGHQRKASVDARGFLRALNEVFFGKFCVDELFYREFREQLVRRIQESTFRYAPDDLQDILDDVVEACKSTRLNLDAVSQWRLNYLARDQTASVIDHVFLMNANVMTYDAKHSSMCLDTFCADPLCGEIHAGRVTEADKARAFRRVLNVVLNEALRVRLVSKEQKAAVRARLVKGVFAVEDRVNAVRELAVLVMLAQDERHRDVAAYALARGGQAWTQSDASVTDVDEDCNLDPDMVYRKALGAVGNAYLESILDVRRLGMSISADEVERLRALWARASTRDAAARVVTLPMLLHVLVHSSETELQEALPQGGVALAMLAKSDATAPASRIEQVEDAALQIVQNLGLAWELGDNPPRDLRQFCMVLLLALGSALAALVVAEPAADVSADADAREIGAVEDGLFARWWDVCDAVVRFERAQRRVHAALLVMYVRVASEKLLAQKADFDPELFLAVVLELLTELRKRRPDYEPIALTADGRLRAADDAARRALDRRTREDIGSEFDRLYAWVDQQLPPANRVRALLARSRTASWQADKARSSSAASIGYNSGSGGTRVATPAPPMPAHALSKERL
ncbi:hypothetical protein H4S01_003379 [Coemansia sp. RSA 2610]|nr:hypothetical protein H4S01_003379 [Coemansia sp. RSA 2610]